MQSSANSGRIVISINTSWNIVNFRAGLTKALCAAGYEVVALAPPDAHTPRLQELGCRFLPIHMDNKGTNPVKDATLFARYLLRLRQIQPDVYLGYTVKPNLYGSLAAQVLGIPVVNNVSGLGTTFIGGGPLQHLVEMLYRRAFARSQCVFFQNRDDQALFLERRLVRPAQTGLLPGSGINVERFHPMAVCPAVRQKGIRFLFIGRLLRDKGVCEYVQAAQRIKSQVSNTTFAILGFLEAQNRTAIEQATMDQWVAGGVIEYLGATDDVRSHIGAADCVVLPSYREGTPRTLLEAAAMGKPIIATDVPGCREVVINGENGLLCRVKDPDDLAQKMIKFINLPPSHRHSMGTAGRKKIEHEFDEKIVIEKYLETIAQLSDQSLRSRNTSDVRKSNERYYFRDRARHAAHRSDAA